MTKYTRKFVAGFAAVALLASSFSGVALAGTTIEISGNGAGSDNWTTVNQGSTTNVQQSNTANVTNTVDSNAKTGGNDANFNTGGDVVISTGDASTKTTVTNTLNSNQAQVDCCAAGGTEVKVSGNGANSDNGVALSQGTTTTVSQGNLANVTNNIDSNAKTGYNDANKNTGGDVVIHTGDAKVEAYVSTLANVNSARVAGGYGSNPTAKFWITDNGAGSDNYITANLGNSTVISQGNTANITNDVEADAKTGGNDANFNTGGDVIIDTGYAKVYADVDNAVNFNYADVDCGCTWDVMAKISGNGAATDSKYSKHGRHHKNHADNIITLNLGTEQVIGQGNLANLTNDLDDLNAKTGYNEAELNTGSDYSDPAILTGDALINSSVSNEGNVNTVGSMIDWNWPQVPQVDFSFNFAAMMAFFGFWM